MVGFAASTRLKERPGYNTSVETTVYVAEGNEGQGIGTLLYAELLGRVQAAGIHAVVAPCGDAWEALDFPRSFYTNDKKHPSAEGALLNSLVLFRAIYQRDVASHVSPLALKIHSHTYYGVII